MKEGGVLQQHVAVVTGGGRGIGAAIANKLAGLGAEVVICGRSLQTLKATTDRIRGAGGKCEAAECDVTDMHSVEKLTEWVEKRFGRVDILVNNAGVGGFGGPLHSLPPDAWDGI